MPMNKVPAINYTAERTPFAPSPEQLSPQELQEVLIIHRRMESRQSSDRALSDCRDARDRAL
jgi:hypothetical protein